MCREWDGSHPNRGIYIDQIHVGPHTSLRERVCCLLVLDSAASTPQWIRQPKPRGSWLTCVLST
jgi:hypothetical protein